jgi:bile acid:Na+ symporter, BASS family
MSATVVDVLVSTVLALVMFGVGLSLTATQFRRVVRYPKELLLALCSQMVALPAIAFALALLRPDLPAEIKTGFIILAASPGGATSGFITYLFRGNVALSLSLTTANSLLTILSIPVVVNMALAFFMGQHTELHLPFWDTVWHIFSITIIPASLGIVLQQRWPQWAMRVQRPARYMMLILLLVVFLIKILAGAEQGGTNLTLGDVALVLPHGLLQNACCLLFGYFFLRYFGAPHPSRLTAAIESGVQNTTLSFLIAGTLIGNQVMVIPPLVYALFSFITACLFGYAANKLNGRKKVMNL